MSKDTTDSGVITTLTNPRFIEVKTDGAKGSYEEHLDGSGVNAWNFALAAYPWLRNIVEDDRMLTANQDGGPMWQLWTTDSVNPRAHMLDLAAKWDAIAADGRDRHSTTMRGCARDLRELAGRPS